jgi:Ni/Co efflux regulator RcnB
MKKQLILAVLSAALMAAPFADAASGFSRSKSTSSSSSSKVSSSKVSSSSTASKRDSGISGFKPTRRDSVSSSDTRASSGSTTPTPKRDYGSSGWGWGSGSRTAEAPKPVVPVRVAPTVAPAAAAAAAPAQSGFGTEMKSSTKKKLAGAAGATALGAALYAGQANHDAVAAYESSQQPAPVAAAPSAERSTDRTAAIPSSTTKYDSRTASVPSQPAPQVIVVKEHHYSRDDARYDMDQSYRDGVRDAQRQARMNGPAINYEPVRLPSLQSTPRAQVAQPSVAAPAATQSSSGIGSFILWTIVILMIFGALGYLVTQVLTSGGTKSSAKPASRKSNYTL